ncbi:hypothetical protein EZ456_23740 [Pedobacter psychrodurus]|uniref:Uncharacterized protein n=1 Tax=Pedobacter psychrodurus TaxID=2530456 RepID=A0A4R0PNQ9_9SPHI|nr:hypothetical protein [Pedobacter psychrodurus]TCD16964.1 hypothetical protein EZ456_23740 [Pedobacter psychrodurus]
MSDSLLKITLNPDLDKLSAYISKAMIARYQKTGVYLESTMSESYYNKIHDSLIKTFEKNNLIEHKDELLYIILTEDEILGDMMLDAEMQYEELQNTIEVSEFLLAFKRATDNPNFQIGIKENIGTTFKPKTQSAYIRNHEISKWMCQLIFDAFEARNYPRHLLGDTFLEQFYKYNEDPNTPIDLSNLEKVTKLKNKNPSVLKRKKYVELCKYVGKYLELHTHLNTPDGVKLTDARAEFYFDILEALNILNRHTIQSDPKDYITSMFQKHND